MIARADGSPFATAGGVKSRLIVNPGAGSEEGAAAVLRLNERLRAYFGDLDIVVTASAGDARHGAQQAVEQGYELLFIAGGDGTLHEALNGVCQAGRGISAVTFGIVPLGTGNDFATALGIPDDPDAAIDLLARGRSRLVDVGRLNGNCFVNVSAGGFVAEVSDAVTPELKTVAGKLAYLIGGAQVLVNYEPVQVTWRTSAAAPLTRAKLELFAVCNSRLVGGGRLIAPDAVLDDGLLDVCFVEDMPTVDFVRLLRRVSDGDHLEDARVTYFRTRELEIAFDRPRKVNMDGQVIETDRGCYSVLPRAARFLAADERSA
jgi:diacylglycerol kinase (ATP)